MDNYQFWLYVIVALIYVISRAMKKANEKRRTQGPGTPVDVDQHEAADSGEEQRPLTFEELLREITEGKRGRPAGRQAKPEVRPKARPAYVDYDDDLSDEEKSLEDVDFNYKKADSASEVFEKAKKDAISSSSVRDTTLPEEPMSYGRFNEFRIGSKNTLLQEYVKELKRPSGFKKAIVLSEILKPRF
jgi:hypothetical protein